MRPTEITKADFLARIYNFEASPQQWKFEGDRPAIIDFYATWCGPCKMIAPILDDLAAEYGAKIAFYKVDTDREQELAAAFGIRSIPTLLFIPKEGEPRIMQGAMSKAQFREVINDFLLK